MTLPISGGLRSRDGRCAVREYVPSHQLAGEIEHWLGREQLNSIEALARRSQVSARAISKVLRGEAQWVSVFLADALMLAIGAHVMQLDAQWLTVIGKRPMPEPAVL